MGGSFAGFGELCPSMWTCPYPSIGRACLYVEMNAPTVETDQDEGCCQRLLLALSDGLEQRILAEPCPVALLWWLEGL